MLLNFDIWLSSPKRFLISSWALIWLDSACALWTGHSQEKSQVDRALSQFNPLISGIASPPASACLIFTPVCCTVGASAHRVRVLSLQLFSHKFFETPKPSLASGPYSVILGMVSRCLQSPGAWDLANSPREMFVQDGRITSVQFSFPTDFGPSSPDCLDDPESSVIFSDPWDMHSLLGLYALNSNLQMSSEREASLSLLSSLLPPPGDDLGCLGCIWCLQTAVSLTFYPALMTIICGSVGLAQHIL